MAAHDAGGHRDAPPRYEWRQIERSGGLTGAELLAEARSIPRIYNNQISSMDDPELKRKLVQYKKAASSAIARAP